MPRQENAEHRVRRLPETWLGQYGFWQAALKLTLQTVRLTWTRIIPGDSYHSRKAGGSPPARVTLARVPIHERRAAKSEKLGAKHFKRLIIPFASMSCQPMERSIASVTKPSMDQEREQ
jgi:hypothetical protein